MDDFAQRIIPKVRINFTNDDAKEALQKMGVLPDETGNVVLDAIQFVGLLALSNKSVPIVQTIILQWEADG